MSDSDQVNPFQEQSERSDRDEQNNKDGLSNFNPFQQNQNEDNDFEYDRKYTPPKEGIDNPFAKKGDEQMGDKPLTGEEKRFYLEKRNLELDEKEREIEKREKYLGEDLHRPHNWPKCYPILHHNIATDIPKENRGMIRLAYLAWIWGVIGTSWNLICVFAKLSVDGAPNKGNDVGLGLAYFLFSPPLSWIFWYRLLYKATRKNKSLKFFTFFCTFFFWMLFSAVFIIGVSGTGCGGVINLVKAFDLKAQTVGILMVVNMLIWFVQLIADVFIFRLVHRFYRSSGGSAEKAKQEATESVAKMTTDFQKEVAKQQIKQV
ncbi:secretory carrier-associated membrane protein [Anaeramoeba ignava]|uniref:Secretory carrier-associated membrane protein n=1 Tax=Anaeramoeba ignava TaxID=1746090 RepID=A0A9Q0LH49_ANAIG|nr:secretory carrier-associated membrane protein [Anaeramoeba ignava]|eukprot:Anaeramoba_ignava/a1819_44.p1 GENE.a1819_44~~a1819_44.p1  ORF type:complete len:318 (+),score=96.80 a1819_44:233-1186(+)